MESMACRSLLDRASGRSEVAWRDWVGFRNTNGRRHWVRTRSDAWGHGYATEALGAVVVVARDLGVQRLYALCHPKHPASIHVLEKCGFVLEDLLAAFADFPNLISVPGSARIAYVTHKFPFGIKPRDDSCSLA